MAYHTLPGNLSMQAKVEKKALAKKYEATAFIFYAIIARLGDLKKRGQDMATRVEEEA